MLNISKMGYGELLVLYSSIKGELRGMNEELDMMIDDGYDSYDIEGLEDEIMNKESEMILVSNRLKELRDNG
jgi:hypothetical protein